MEIHDSKLYQAFWKSFVESIYFKSFKIVGEQPRLHRVNSFFIQVFLCLYRCSVTCAAWMFLLLFSLFILNIRHYQLIN